MGAGGGWGGRSLVGDWTGDSHLVVRVFGVVRLFSYSYHYRIILDVRRATTGEVVKTVNLSCGVSEDILGLRLKALQALQEKVSYHMESFLS